LPVDSLFCWRWFVTNILTFFFHPFIALKKLKFYSVNLSMKSLEKNFKIDIERMLEQVSICK